MWWVVSLGAGAADTAVAAIKAATERRVLVSCILKKECRGRNVVGLV